MIKNRKETNVRSIISMKEKRDFDGRRIEAFHNNLKMQQAAREEKETKAKQVWQDSKFASYWIIAFIWQIKNEGLGKFMNINVKGTDFYFLFFIVMSWTWSGRYKP